MLTSLVIQDVVLIDRLELTLTKGLNVFTGETGAGKSILMDALSLALGARSDAGLVRSGTKQACVTASFETDLPPELFAFMEEQALSAEEPIILRRTVSQDGKSRAFVNDHPISVALLRQIGDFLLEVHGQFETHGLLNPATHRGLLDAFAGVAALKKETSLAYTHWQKAEKEYTEALKSRARSEAEAEYLRAAVTELDDLAPQKGEIDVLSEKRKGLQHREKILDSLQSSKNALLGKYGANLSLIKAGKALSQIADKAEKISGILNIIDRASADAEEACRQISGFVYEMEIDNESLDSVEERLFRLRAIARKHNVPPEDLDRLREDLRAKLELLDDQTGTIATMARATQEARTTYIKLAEKLSTKRNKAATNMAHGVMEELPPLKLERAVFSVLCERLPEDQWSGQGLDNVMFLVATNLGANAGPLHKIASGGELARFMLALKVILCQADPISTLVFDEVDSGIGGATASAVGERLAKLGQHMQVLVVTHSPQVAARAVSHLKVEKQVKGKQTIAHVLSLNADQRLEEIARMLAGETTTDAARQAARSLIEGTAKEKKKTKKA